MTFKGNPIDVLEPIAKAKTPLLHLVTLKDQTVPPKENTFVLAERYRKLGGNIDIIEIHDSVPPTHHQYKGKQLTANYVKIVDFIENRWQESTARQL